MVLLRNYTPKDTFDSRYKLSFRAYNNKKISDKAFDVQDNLGKIKEYQFNIYNSCILQYTCWPTFQI